jgi:hypothetical protein
MAGVGIDYRSLVAGPAARKFGEQEPEVGVSGSSEVTLWAF